MKKFVCLILFFVIACYTFGAVSGCQSMGSNKKKDNGLSTGTQDFLNSKRP